MHRRALLLGLMTGCWTESKPAPTAPPPSNRRVVKDVVQPVTIERIDDADGEVGGVEGGGVGGMVGGPPPPPPPPPPPRMNVPPTVLEQNRIAGDKLIAPDAITADAIAADGKTKVIASFKLCVSDSGDVTVVTLLKSSGYPAYDTVLATGMRTWRYRPYEVNGHGVPICTAVTFIWSR